MRPLKPAFGEKDYHELRKVDLRDLLVRRGLRRSGTKAAMIARLKEDDYAR